nr:Chain P, a peptide from osteopontin [synthetic construct]
VATWLNPDPSQK